jgi:hypothetical protein
MSQLFSDLDFSTASEARYRIPIGGIVVQFNLEHNGLVRLDGTTQRRIDRLLACRVPGMKKSHQNKL